MDDVSNFSPDLDTSADHFEFGLSYDTNLAANRLLNYRINANVQFVDQELNVPGANLGHIQGSGVALNQVIGFGILRSPRMRIFIGPSLHLGVVVFDDRIRLGGGATTEFEEVLITASIGPELGLNLHLAKHLTVSLSAHYRYGLQIQAYDKPFATSSNDDQVFFGDEHRVGVTTAFYFRFSGDQYKPAKVRAKTRRNQRRNATGGDV